MGEQPHSSHRARSGSRSYSLVDRATSSTPASLPRPQLRSPRRTTTGLRSSPITEPINIPASSDGYRDIASYSSSGSRILAYYQHAEGSSPRRKQSSPATMSSPSSSSRLSSSSHSSSVAPTSSSPGSFVPQPALPYASPSAARPELPRPLPPSASRRSTVNTDGPLLSSANVPKVPRRRVTTSSAPEKASRCHFIDTVIG